MAETPSVHILLVDDEPSVLFALKLLLQALGYGVSEFAVASEALSFLQEGKRADMFLCDLKMPRMNGIEVLSEAKKIRPALPFILMSAHATNDEIDHAHTLGATGFLAKPFSAEELHRIVREIGTSAN
jgi:two-component system chemotaxis response regulator CheY